RVRAVEGQSHLHLAAVADRQEADERRAGGGDPGGGHRLADPPDGLVDRLFQRVALVAAGEHDRGSRRQLRRGDGGVDGHGSPTTTRISLAATWSPSRARTSVTTPA